MGKGTTEETKKLTSDPSTVLSNIYIQIKAKSGKQPQVSDDNSPPPLTKPRSSSEPKFESDEETIETNTNSNTPVPTRTSSPMNNFCPVPASASTSNNNGIISYLDVAGIGAGPPNPSRSTSENNDALSVAQASPTPETLVTIPSEEPPISEPEDEEKTQQKNQENLTHLNKIAKLFLDEKPMATDGKVALVLSVLFGCFTAVPNYLLGGSEVQKVINNLTGQGRNGSMEPDVFAKFCAWVNFFINAAINTRSSQSFYKKMKDESFERGYSEGEFKILFFFLTFTSILGAYPNVPIMKDAIRTSKDPWAESLKNFPAEDICSWLVGGIIALLNYRGGIDFAAIFLGKDRANIAETLKEKLLNAFNEKLPEDQKLALKELKILAGGSLTKTDYPNLNLAIKVLAFFAVVPYSASFGLLAAKDAGIAIKIFSGMGAALKATFLGTSNVRTLPKLIPCLHKNIINVNDSELNGSFEKSWKVLCGFLALISITSSGKVVLDSGLVKEAWGSLSLGGMAAFGINYEDFSGVSLTLLKAVGNECLNKEAKVKAQYGDNLVHFYLRCMKKITKMSVHDILTQYAQIEKSDNKILCGLLKYGNEVSMPIDRTSYTEAPIKSKLSNLADEISTYLPQATTVKKDPDLETPISQEEQLFQNFLNNEIKETRNGKLAPLVVKFSACYNDYAKSKTCWTGLRRRRNSNSQLYTPVNRPGAAVASGGSTSHYQSLQQS